MTVGNDCKDNKKFRKSQKYDTKNIKADKQTAFICKKDELARLLNQCKKAADGHVEIDDGAEMRQGNTSEDEAADPRAKEDGGDAPSPHGKDGGRDATMTGPEQRHHEVTDEEVGLRHGNIALLRAVGTDEIEHGGGSLHGKEATHKTAQRAHRDLDGERRGETETVLEEGKPRCGRNEDYTEDAA